MSAPQRRRAAGAAGQEPLSRGATSIRSSRQVATRPGKARLWRRWRAGRQRQGATSKARAAVASPLPRCGGRSALRASPAACSAASLFAPRILRTRMRARMALCACPRLSRRERGMPIARLAVHAPLQVEEEEEEEMRDEGVAGIRGASSWFSLARGLGGCDGLHSVSHASDASSRLPASACHRAT
jgi:hypothetical protein